MADSSHLLADPHRELHSREWYNQNAPNANRISWRLHLCVSSEVIEDFIPQVQVALHEAALAGRPIDRNAPAESLRVVAEQLAQLRPDLVCPELPFDAFANVVKAMAIKLNKSESPLEQPGLEQNSKRKALDKPVSSERPEKAARVSGKSSPSLDTSHQGQVNQSNGHQNEEATQEVELDDVNRSETEMKIIGAPEDLTSLTAPTKHSPRRRLVHANPNTSNFGFDIELVTISLLDYERIGNVQIAPLKAILDPRRNYDIQTCAGLRLDELAGAFEAFDPDEEQLWCEIDDIEHRVTSPETFKILCRWQIEDSLAKNPRIPPRIRFEKRPGITVHGSRRIGREMRLENASCEKSDSTTSSSSLWTWSVRKATTKGADRDSPMELNEPQTARDDAALADKLHVSKSGAHSPDSDSDLPLLQSVEGKSGQSSGNESKPEEPSPESSPLSAIIVLSRPLSQRRSTMSDQLLENFQKPLLPTPSVEAAEMQHHGQNGKTKKKSSDGEQGQKRTAKSEG